LPANTHAVALAAKNVWHLETLEQHLIALRIPHMAIREPDRDNELMAIGISPTHDRAILKPVTGKLRLLA
jgi:hypothetical protein